MLSTAGFFFFTEILPELDLMSFYSGDKLLLFQEPKYFPLDFNINYNLFSVISFLSIGFFSSCIANCQIALAFLCWILITVFFLFCSSENNHIQNRSYIFCFCFLSKPVLHSYQQYHREGPEKIEDHWTQFSCLLFIFWIFCFCGCCC